MRANAIIILILVSIGCKEQITKDSISQNCFPYKLVDSIRIYFISDKFGYEYTDSIIVAGKKYINPINDYYFSKVDTKTYDVAYDSVITLVEEKSILGLQSIFKPVRFSYSLSTKCEPIYRDAIIFYKQNKVVGAIKICFECEKMLFNKVDDRNKYLLDSKQFKILKDYFNKNIHPINH